MPGVAVRINILSCHQHPGNPHEQVGILAVRIFGGKRRKKVVHSGDESNDGADALDR